jgi:hypothetical protein
LGNAPSHCRSTAWDALGFATHTRTDPADTSFFEMESGDLDPRQLVTELNRVLPKDWEYANGSGPNAFFTTQMQGGGDDHFLTIRDLARSAMSCVMLSAPRRPGQKVRLS